MLTGNREFNEIYEEYKNLVLKAAYIYSGNDYDAAEDITQDTFLKLYTNFDRLKNGNVYAWLYTAAKNAAINYRTRSGREVLELDDEESGIEDPAANSTEARVCLERKEQAPPEDNCRAAGKESKMV